MLFCLHTIIYKTINTFSAIFTPKNLSRLSKQYFEYSCDFIFMFTKAMFISASSIHMFQICH